MYKQSFYFLLRFLIVIIGIIATYFTIKYSFMFLYPFVIAIMLTLLLNPIVNYMEHKLRFPRTLASILSIMMFVSLIGGIIFFLIAEIIQGTTYLAEKIPSTFEHSVLYFKQFLQTEILPYYYKILNIFHQLNEAHQLRINETIEQMTNQLIDGGSRWLQTLLLKIPVIVSFLPQSFTVILIIILATFLITNDMENIKKTYNTLIPSSANRSAKRIYFHLRHTFLLFVRAQIILIFISGVIIYVSFIILKIEHALTITFIAALADLLPYIGIGIIFIPWVIYLFFTGHYSLTISIIVVYMLVIISKQLLEPKIVATNVGVNPLLALFVLFFSFQIWGIGGLLITPFLLITVAALYKARVIHQVWDFIKG